MARIRSQVGTARREGHKRIDNNSLLQLRECAMTNILWPARKVLGADFQIRKQPQMMKDSTKNRRQPRSMSEATYRRDTLPFQASVPDILYVSW